MPKLNLNVSVLSLEPLVIGCANEKLKGPTGVYQSTPITKASTDKTERFRFNLGTTF